MSAPALPRSADAVAALCPECGLCCDGTLFGDVELQAGDDAAALAAAGLRLVPKRSRRAFAQPCACFAASLCRIYDQRPARCRSFECRQIARLRAGELSTAGALKNIRAARTLADEVRRLVRQLGNHDEAAPLNRRYAAVMAQPIHFATGEAALELRGELLVAVDRLVGVLERDFLA